jgi:large subunit ribosomal protein L23
MRNPYDILTMPHMSEKSDRLKENQNKITLIVRRDANKVEIKRAIQEMFKVKVLDVNVVNMPGKVKRLGMRSGKRPDWKKAVATLAPGEKVDFIEGV